MGFRYLYEMLTIMKFIHERCILCVKVMSCEQIVKLYVNAINCARKGCFSTKMMNVARVAAFFLQKNWPRKIDVRIRRRNSNVESKNSNGIVVYTNGY